MSHPNAPPPYTDRDPLYPPRPGEYPQPGGYYPQPGGYYPQPGGYNPQPAGYPEPGRGPQPVPPMPPIPSVPLNIGGAEGYGPQVEAGGFGSWDDKAVRHAFIRRVYLIITLQLLVTVGIIAIFTFVEPVTTFVQRNPAINYASYAVFFVTYMVLVCCEGPRRRFPWNIILLAVLTLAMGLMTGTIASLYSSKAVIICIGITAIITIAITVFCFQTKVDFTSCAGLFAILGIVLFIVGIVTAIVLAFKYIYWLHMLYAGLGAVAFTLFLAYDTQLVLGNRKHTISPEEYVYGALKIYTDIVYIFLNLLQIVGSRT
ncbi:protein lifeguard 3 [Rhinatrema bivittatum]|uniref:protein lifeguard 3 n=1 Tax=Rhinatrema bivittatum TaxID=194408 RepID=UPI001128B13C|nr:protein lifeguard 3 [Rhinatrema bivittatum]